MGGYASFIARRYLTAARRGALVGVIEIFSVLGLALGVSAMILVLAASAGFRDALVDSLRRVNAHLTVFGPESGIPAEAQAKITAELLADERVVQAYPVVFATGLMETRASESSKVLKIIGIRTEDLAAQADLGAMVFPEPKALDLEDAVLLGEDLAVAVGVHEGEPVDLVLPRLNVGPFGAMPRVVRRTLTGTVDTDTPLMDQEMALLPLADMQRLLGLDDRVSSIQVRVRDIEDITPVRARIDETLASMPGYFIVDLMDQNREYFAALEFEKRIMLLVLILIPAVASLSIVSTLVILITSKSRDMGVFLTLGATRGGIARIFLLQGMSLGVSGTLIGVGAGVGLAEWWDRAKVFRLPPAYPLSHLPFHVHPGHVLLAAGAALTICFLVSLIPAWRAGAIAAAEALRYD